MFARMLTIRAAGQIPTMPKPFEGAPMYIAIFVLCEVGLSSETGPSSEIRSITPAVSAFGSTPVPTRQIIAAGPGGVVFSRKSARAALAWAVTSTCSAAAGTAPTSARVTAAANARIMGGRQTTLRGNLPRRGVIFKPR